MTQKLKPFAFGPRSMARLKGLHPDLVRVLMMALVLSPIDFSIVEGVRTKARQRELFRSGASWTMDSRHLTGHAVDIAPYIDGAVRWDWPPFYVLAKAMKDAAKKLNVPIVWGGDWKQQDGPHFELNRKAYP